jgi:carbon starvation protein
VLSPAKDAAQMDQIIVNTAVQGTLSIVFAVLVLVVVAAAVLVVVKTLRSGHTSTSETQAVTSTIFAPRSFVASKAEREALALWDEAGLDPSPAGRHNH